MNSETYENIQTRMRENITDLDLKRYFPETNQPNDNVIKYSELADLDSLEEILPYDKSWKIILIEQEYNLGHWTCVMRYGNFFEQFDSYGKKIDDELKFVTEIQKKLLGEDKKYLTALFKKLPRGSKKVWNKKKLQKLVNASATCGRWCIVRIIMMEMGFTLKQFQDFIERWRLIMNPSPYELVALWVK
jgi:hypothetical protein